MTHPPRDWLVGFRRCGYKPKFSEPHTVKLPSDVAEDGTRRVRRHGRWCPHGPWFRLRDEAES